MFAGITVMFGVGALLAPQVGRLIDRTGARTIMASGSALYAVSLAALAFSQGLVSYLLCWAAMGIASTLALSTPSSIAHRPGRGTGRAARHRHAGHHRRLRLDRVLAALGRARRGGGLARHAAGLCRDPSLRLPARPSAGAAAPAAGAPSRRRGQSSGERRAVRSALARLPAPVGDALQRRLRVHRRHGAHDRADARARPSRRLGGVPGLADRPLAGHGAPVRAAVRPSLLDHELGRVRLGHAGRWGWAWR